jgi:hypothetical protein
MGCLRLVPKAINSLVNVQICTRKVPFHYKQEMTIPFLVLSGKHPMRPSEEDCGGHAMPDELWEMAQECWSMKPEDRPSIESLVRRLERS